MSKKLKVFGGMIFYGTPRKQVRVLVASYTKKQAVELLNTITCVNYNSFNDYFSETGNSIELSIATEIGMWITNEKYNKTTENYTKLLKYTEIKDLKQYNEYCDTLEKFIFQNKEIEDIETLTQLIEKWDNEHNTFNTDSEKI